MIKQLAYDNDIILFCLASKITLKLQPLDISIFSVLQHAWNAHSGDLAAKRITIDHHNFIPEYLAVWEKAIIPELIIKAFQKTGIFPFYPSVFLEEDFRPSMALSSGLHIPTLYSDLTPFSPPAIPTDNDNSDNNFILGCSSDVEIDSGNNKDNSDDKGYWKIMEEQVSKALNHTKDGMATGLDGCPYKLWKMLEK